MKRGVDPPSLEQLAQQLYQDPEDKTAEGQIRQALRPLLCSRAGMCGAAPGDEEQVADRVLDKIIKKICCGEYEAHRGEVSVYAMGFVDYTVMEFYRDEPRTVGLLPEHEDLQPAPEPEPEQDQTELDAVMGQAIGLLSPTNQKAIIDHYVEFKTYEEMAQERVVTVEAVRQLCWRARKELRTKIELVQPGKVRLKTGPVTED